MLSSTDGIQRGTSYSLSRRSRRSSPSHLPLQELESDLIKDITMDVIVLAFYEPLLIFLFFLWQWWSLRKDKALLREQRKREAKEGLDVPGT